MLVGEARRGPSAPAHSLPGSGPGWEEALPCLCGGQRHGLDRAPTTFSRLQAVFHFVGHTHLVPGPVLAAAPAPPAAHQALPSLVGRVLQALRQC